MNSIIAEIALALSRQVELLILVKGTLLLVIGLTAVGLTRHARLALFTGFIRWFGWPGGGYCSKPSEPVTMQWCRVQSTRNMQCS